MIVMLSGGLNSPFLNEYGRNVARLFGFVTLFTPFVVWYEAAGWLRRLELDERGAHTYYALGPLRLRERALRWNKVEEFDLTVAGAELLAMRLTGADGDTTGAGMWDRNLKEAALFAAAHVPENALTERARIVLGQLHSTPGAS